MTHSGVAGRSPSVGWGAMIICGTVVGAGMFTLPVVMAGAWYGWSLLILLISWGSMLFSGLLFLNASRHYPAGAGYDTVTKDLLGRGWAGVTGLSIVFVLGILTYAYISASGPVYQHSLAAAGLPVSTAGAKILLTLCVAGIVWLGTKGVSRLMTFSLVAKIVLLLALFGGLLMQVDLPTLIDSHASGVTYWPYTLAALPFCLASFGYHGNITGLISYYGGEEKAVKKALILGTLLALFLYLFWITSTMGNLPRSSFPAIIGQGGDVAALLDALRNQLHVNALTLLMAVFSHFAILCSFLGVTAGLFDFIADRFGVGDSPGARFNIAVLTFLPPLSASLWWPDGFVTAIGYAGLCATLWAVIIPAMLVLKARKRFPTPSSGRWQQNLMILAVLTFGVLNIVAWTLSELNLLPVYR